MRPLTFARVTLGEISRKRNESGRAATIPMSSALPKTARIPAAMWYSYVSAKAKQRIRLAATKTHRNMEEMSMRPRSQDRALGLAVLLKSKKRTAIVSSGNAMAAIVPRLPK